jgi:hypothetical protein
MTTSPDDPRIGTDAELRLYAAECLNLAALYAAHGRELAEAGDDQGLVTNTQKLIAAVKAAAATVRDLRGRTCTR